MSCSMLHRQSEQLLGPVARNLACAQHLLHVGGTNAARHPCLQPRAKKLHSAFDPTSAAALHAKQHRALGVGLRSFASSSSSSSTAAGPIAAEPALKFALEQAFVEAGTSSGPLAIYEGLVSSGELQRDPHQQRLMEIFNAMFHGLKRNDARGLYIYGSVGCGKTMAMDLFLSSLKASTLREALPEFLNSVQLQLHRFRQESLKSGEGRSPVERVAHSIADRLDVLCFDEFAITTIQDCVLLLPLFSILFQRRVAVVATSNRAPEDLYTDGLNRHLYLPPFLEALRGNCKVHHLQIGTDYRRVRHSESADAGVFCAPHSREFIDRWMEGVTAPFGSAPGSLEVSFGRSIAVPQLSRCGRIARFAFDDLCRRHVSADDFMWICRQVHTLLLDDVPQLRVDDHNEARRFTLLIDHCYEQHVRLIAGMAGSPEEILGGLSELRNMGMGELGSDGAVAGCGDGDTSPSSSGVLEAIRRIKKSMAEKAHRDGAATSQEGAEVLPNGLQVEQVLEAEMDRVRSHGSEDMDVWRQRPGGGSDLGRRAPPQVSKAWDDRRRISQFTWESADPTAEQQTIKGVFTAAVASLKESGFAVDRAISRLKEMQTVAFQEHHRLKHQLDEHQYIPAPSSKKDSFEPPSASP
eukprot:CAMPEP_0178371114 /NCGR_PEP_ID=MMETSP0689_2-20121128/657_1 /TAXON_ID=160604 /ORGANISM="Amphidinium massartii, Strain CS-259" /LENGTH=636 /DNA_ID=CAMNT_0019990969 /DNA_START=73 /DNA_END=1981 /DNA_ORIENTATION=+